LNQQKRTQTGFYVRKISVVDEKLPEIAKSFNKNLLQDLKKENRKSTSGNKYIFKNIRDDINETLLEEQSNLKNSTNENLYQKHVKLWTIHDVSLWLEQIGFQECKEKFLVIHSLPTHLSE
jgi:hypothetical protein